jgi:hypothetical protein
MTLALAIGAWVLLRDFPYGRVFGALVFCLICFLSWYLPNKDGLREQRELEKLKVDCGWIVYRTAQDVSGIYVDSPEPSYIDSRFLPLLQRYKTLEYPEQDGRVVQLTATVGQANPSKTYVSSRSQRYGLIKKTSKTASFRREETVVFDHEANQVLAKDVEYWPNDSPGPTTVVEYAIQVLLVRPDICQSIINPDLNQRITEVAVPEQKGK